MRQLIIIILFGHALLSCKQKDIETNADTNTPTLTFDLAKTDQIFKDNIKDYVRRWNEENRDSIATGVIRDSTFIFKLDTADLFVVLSQYQTLDNRKTLGLISIENFGRETIPTYLISDDNADKYLGDSVSVTNGRLFIFGRILKNQEPKSFKLTFDLNFNGQTFPWKVE